MAVRHSLSTWPFLRSPEVGLVGRGYGTKMGVMGYSIDTLHHVIAVRVLLLWILVTKELLDYRSFQLLHCCGTSTMNIRLRSKKRAR